MTKNLVFYASFFLTLLSAESFGGLADFNIYFVLTVSGLTFQHGSMETGA
jgi:hypothetical protein